MKPSLPFIKMHGCGNDYVFVTQQDIAPYNKQLPELARRISDRHKGVGSDGLIVIGPSETADARMRIFNADGSEAEMCGNGIRCVGRYIVENEMADGLDLAVETLAGIKRLWVSPELNSVKVAICEVSDSLFPMGVKINPVSLPGGKEIKVLEVNVGNPHAVIVTDCPVENIPVCLLGPQIENHARWQPCRINVEWVNILDRANVAMRPWERGSGETMASGTGSTATAVAAMALGLVDNNKVTVHLRGGDLVLEWPGYPSGTIYMTGPAEVAFTGVYVP